MSANLAAVLYLVAGSMFIMALRGLSSPATSRTGNTYGMVGMGIAVLTTLALAKPSSPIVWLLILAGIGIGAVIGGITAKRIPMTAMPQLVAAFHSPHSTHQMPLASPPMAKSIPRPALKWVLVRPSVRSRLPAPSLPS
jgi:NAD/NADP transhydrogenase beta subunit